MPMPFPALQNLKVFGFVFAEKLMLLLGCNASLLVEQESYVTDGMVPEFHSKRGSFVYTVQVSGILRIFSFKHARKEFTMDHGCYHFLLPKVDERWRMKGSFPDCGHIVRAVRETLPLGNMKNRPSPA